MLELQEALSLVDANFKSVESTINVLNVPSSPFTLGNTALLNHETDPDRQNAYTELVNSYKWYEKTHLYSALANTMLSHNSLKRSLFSSSNKRRLVTPSAHIAPPRLVDQIISSLNINNMTIKIYRPFATNAFLHVSRKIFQIILLLKINSAIFR